MSEIALLRFAASCLYDAADLPTLGLARTAALHLAVRALWSAGERRLAARARVAMRGNADTAALLDEVLGLARRQEAAWRLAA